MEAIEILVKEHESILKVISITKTILNTNDKITVDMNHVAQIIDFIKNFADKYHHLKEEDVLFVEMINHGMSCEGGPIAVMLSEHTTGRNYVKQAVAAIEQFKSGDDAAFALIQENLLGYCELLTAHIHKENNILYPMAERVVPVEVFDAMVTHFNTANHSTNHNEYYDKYLKLVDDLSSKYL